MRLNQRSLVAKGLLVGLLKPRLSQGVALPGLALDAAARHLGRKGFDSAEAATMIRKAGAGLLDESADLSDLPEFLAAAREILARENDTEATDQEDEPMDAQQVIDEIKRMVLGLPGEEQVEVYKALHDLADDLEAGRVEGDGNAAARHSHLPGARRLGRDMPLHTHPLPGEGEDARRRRQANDLALDAALSRYERAHPVADGRGFAKRFPDAARIKTFG